MSTSKEDLYNEETLSELKNIRSSIEDKGVATLTINKLLQHVQMLKGDDGADGVGIHEVSVSESDSDSTLTIKLSDETRHEFTIPKLKGIDGENGKDGTNATVEIVKVSEGERAEVKNVGTHNNVLLDITIPKPKDGKDGKDGVGIQGKAGIKGDGFKWRGTWSTNATYSKNDLVEYSGSTYISLDTVKSVSPSNDRFWELVAQKGRDGISRGGGGASGVKSLVAGTNVTIDNADPANPIVSATGGGGGGAVSSVNTQTGAVVLTQDDVGDGTTYKQYPATDKTKLDSIATGATANDTDANLKARANHTGTQTLSTISDVTSSAAEMNILDGATLSTTELNYVDGVTSNIQTQLDGKALDSGVVHLSGTETITGDKTFTSAITQDDGTYNVIRDFAGTSATTTSNTHQVYRVPSGNYFLFGTDLADFLSIDTGYMDVHSARITSVATPTTGTDAANRDYADGKVADAINDGTTTVAPSQNAVFDALALKQPLDSDLTTIAGLTATTNNFIVSVSSAWASRTPAQVKTTLSLDNVDNTSDANKPVSTATTTALNLKANIASPTFTGTVSGITAAMVGLGNVDNTSNATERAATRTLTNARITPRVGTTTSSATPSIDSDSYDYYSITALAANITSITVTGTPTDGQKLYISFTDNATPRTIVHGSNFENSGTVTLPTTTVASTRLDTVYVWNTVTSKWRIMGIS